MPEPTPLPTAVALESDYIYRMARPLNDFDAYPIVQAWHDLTHEGVFRHCTDQPCHAIHLTRHNR